MASKKLKLEVDLETTKAKRQLVDMADGAGGSPVDSAAEKTARALEKATKGAKDLGESATNTSVNMREAVKVFGGMAIGMAAQVSADYFGKGSAIGTSLNIAGGMLNGAMLGKIAGPKGMIAGAVVGGGAAAYESWKDAKNPLEEFQKSNDDYESNRLWASKFRALSEIEPSAVGLGKRAVNEDQTKKVDDRLAEVKKKAIELFEEQNKLEEKTTALLKAGKLKEAEDANNELNKTRSRKEQMESLERSLDTQTKALIREAEELSMLPESRQDNSAVDALSRVGGYFPGGGSGDALLRTSREQVDILRAIERKTGGASWL